MGWNNEDTKIYCDVCETELDEQELMRECPRCERGYCCSNCMTYDDKAHATEYELCKICRDELKEIAINHLSNEMNW